VRVERINSEVAILYRKRVPRQDSLDIESFASVVRENSTRTDERGRSTTGGINRRGSEEPEAQLGPLGHHGREKARARAVSSSTAKKKKVVTTP